MKIVLLSGASKGIGKALAIKLANLNYQGILIARDLEKLKEVGEIAAKQGVRPIIHAGDISDSKFIDRVIEDTINQFGKIDFVINNAGFGIFGPVSSYSEEDWDSVYATNVKGTFLLSQKSLPHLMKEKSGHIISIASDVAKRTFGGGSLYCSSKYAQHAFTEAMRKEVREHGIKVSTVYSGLVDTMFHEEPQGHVSHNNWLSAEDMAESIFFIMNQPKHVVIDELMIHPLEQEY